MIAFRYGVRPALATAASAVTAAATGGVQAAKDASSAAATKAAATIYTMRTLPKKFRCAVSDEEMDAVRLGGASPYVDAAKKPKK